MHKSAHTQENRFSVIFRKNIMIEQFDRGTCMPRLMIASRQTSLALVFANTNPS